MNRPTFAVIPTRDRPLDLLSCLRAVAPQVGTVIVIDNSDGMPAEFWEAARQTVPRPFHLIADPEQPPNLSRLWNHGLEKAAESAGLQIEWDVVVLNDDAIVPPGYVQDLAQQMRSAGAAAAGYRADGPVLHKKPGPTSLSPDQRLPGHAFMLAGERNLRFDERLRWWCGDNDIDMQSRTVGGTLILPGDRVQHRYPDQSTRGVLAAQTGIDMQTFVEKWGFRPW